MATLFAGVKPGEDLLANGRFDSDQMEVPACWLFTGGESGDCKCSMSGGPDGVPSVKFVNPGPELKTFALRQGGLTLVPGAKYRLSAKVRTKDLRSGNFGVAVVNYGWTREAKVGAIASDQDWTEYAAEIEMMPSRPTSEYSVVFFASKFTGEIEAAGLRLEAVSPDALAGSIKVSPGGDTRRPRLVPIRPRLARIPRARREVTFRFYGILPDRTVSGDCDVVLSTFDAETVVRTPLVVGETTVRLPEDAESGRMEVRIVRRADGVEILKDDYRFAVVDEPQDAVDSGRRLNNLVTELLSAPIGTDDAATFDFTLADESWVFLSLPKAGAAVELDGREVIGFGSLGGETFRRIAAGRHAVRTWGGKDARLVVRKVPEIFNYTPFANSRVKENGAYDWAFNERYVFPATTVQNGGYPKKDQLDTLKRRGGVWLENLNTTSISNADDLVRRLRTSPGIVGSRADGVTCDEQFFSKPSRLADYTTGLKAFNAAYKGDRLVYTWGVGKPSAPGVDQEFLSACVNASRGRGRMLSEVYCRTMESESAARDYLTDYLTGTMKALSGIYPGAAGSVGIILANFNQASVLSICHHPEVDCKYFLDLQLNVIANDPTFKDLTCTGYWGSYYADREILRWSMALLRHYCVEGATAMLSERFGYRYLPGHLVNPDFRTGLEGWSVTGAIAADQVAGLGDKQEARWYVAPGLGDHCARFMKVSGETARLVQTAKGLVPGRLYCLQGCVFDLKDVRAKRGDPRRIALELEPDEGVRIEKGLSWRHVSDSKSNSRTDGAFVNVEHVVFRALAPEVEIRISNAAAPDGSELGVNCISLCPYYPETL